MTAGTVDSTITSSGNLTFTQAQDKTINVRNVTQSKGNLNINGGTYRNITYTSTESGTKADIANATVKYGVNATGTQVEIGAGATAKITDCNISVLTNKGNTEMVGTADAGNVINFGGATNNYSGAELTIKGKNTFNKNFGNSGRLIVDEDAEFNLKNILTNNGYLKLGNNNGTIKRDGIVIDYGSNTTDSVRNEANGTIEFYDGKVRCGVTNSGTIIAPDGYELRSVEEDGKKYISIYPYEYVIEVPVSSVDANAITTLNIPCEQRDGKYYFHDITAVSNAIKDNVDTTATFVADKTYYSNPGKATIEANKKLAIDFNGHKVN